MADHAKMYRHMFNATTDAISLLQKAQQEAEEMFVSAPPPDVRVLRPGETADKEPTED